MDLKFALRSLRKNPGFALLAVLVLALGIGANTAVFSVVNAVLLKPLDYRDPDRIVTLSNYWTKTGVHGSVSAPDFRDWHDQSTAFSATAYYSDGDMAVSSGTAAEYAHASRVTPEFFAVFDVVPYAGRLFTAQETKPGSAAAAVISYSYWQSHFAGNARALGQTIRIFDRSLPIIGVMPPGFRFPGKTGVWIPTDTIIPDTTSRGAHNYLAIGRLKPDISLEQAQTQIAGIASRIEQQYPRTNKDKSAVVTRMRDEMVGDVRLTLYLLAGAVALVLLIACANVANLLLAKSTGRVREMAIRAAVGASRGRIVRQLITESMVLALLAGGAGVILAMWGSEALVALGPRNVPRLTEAGIDGGVLAFTFVVSALASLLFGLAPALHASRVDLNDALKQGSTKAMGGRGMGGMRGALVVAEIALSVVLLAGADLLMKSFMALHNVALGYRPENVLVMKTSVPAADVKGARKSTALYKRILAVVAAIPGVSASGATRTLPGRVGSSGGYYIDHAPAEPTLSAPMAVYSIVSPGAFAALGIPIKRGRDFDDGDTYDAQFTAVINEALARKSFPGQDPIGRLIYCGMDSPNLMKITGIVGDIRQYGPAREPSPEIYMPYEQHPRTATGLNILARTATDPAALTDAMRRKLREISPDVPATFTTMEATVSENVAAPRFRTLLLGIFAGLAVCLAMAGVYGVMAYVVGQRASEIGLRMALGASPRDVIGLVLGQGLALVGIGLALGLAGAVVATRLLTSMLFEVEPGDPATYASVALVLAVVAMAASYFPARRAARVDRLVSLRQE